MDENKNDIIKEELNNEASTEATETPAATANETLGEIPQKKKSVKLRNALIRAGAAFLAAIILLFVTYSSILMMIKGAKDVEAVQDEEVGTFVKRDVFAIVGFFDQESEDTAQGEYALVPMSGKFVTVHFTKRYLESATSIANETYKYIHGEGTALDNYVTVEGTTATISEELSAQMYSWFAANKDWMVESRVIADTDDNATYLSDVVLEVDVVNGMNETLVFVLAGLAALCLLYICVEIILIAVGVYSDKPKKEKVSLSIDEGFEKAGGSNESSEKADETNEDPEPVEEVSSEKDVENTSESAEECIKDEENSENNGCSEVQTTEELEVQEEKK